MHNVAGRGTQKPQQSPPRRGRRPTLIALLAATAGLVLIAAVPAQAELCVIVDPLLDVGDCGPVDHGGEASQAQSAGEQEAPVQQPPTTVAYDPERIAVTVERGTSREEATRVFAASPPR